MSEKLSTLLAWCSENDIYIDPRLVLVDNEENGISVYSRDTAIDSLTTLVSIPKSAVLSVRSCSLAEHIPFVPYGHGAHLTLALALYGELLKCPDSRWAGYLQSLPRDAVGIALFWGSDVQQQQQNQAEQKISDDGKQAKAWIVGTEIEKELQGDDGVNLLEDAREYYHSIVEPLLSTQRYPRRCTLCGFLYAYSLVSSRAFLVDAYHGLAMVPIADAFNHEQDHHVHLESNYDVCAVCGSLSECTHDDDAGTIGGATTDAAIADLQIYTEPEKDTCDMVSNLPIAPRSEVFNTYGEHLTNAQLIARYGFALDSNDNDVVSWTLDALPWPAPEHMRHTDFVRLFESVIQSWPRFSRWAASDLVYQPATSFGLGSTTTTGTGTGASTAGGAHHRHGPAAATKRLPWQKPLLCVNSDAKLSHHLWLYCALLAVVQMRETVATGTALGADEMLALLGHIAEMQLYLENSAGGDDGEGGHAIFESGSSAASPHRPPSPPSIITQMASASGRTVPPRNGEAYSLSIKVLAALARTVVSICDARAALVGPEAQMSVGEMGEALDRLDGQAKKVRLAMMEVLSERSILASCRWAWEETTAAWREEWFGE